MRSQSMPTIMALLALLASACSDGTGSRQSSPGVDSIAPIWGYAGTEVRIHGTKFSDSISVFFGAFAAAAVQPQGAAAAIATVPTGLTDGELYDVRVVNRDGGSATLTAAFEAVAPPALQSATPERGTVGTEVRIDGSGFAADSVTVYFGDLEAMRVEQEGGAIFALAPEGIAVGESYDIRVINRGRAADTLTAGFSAVAPSVARVNGATRPTGLVGMTVIIEGDAYADILGTGKVFFRGSAGEDIEAAVVDSLQDWTNQFIVTTVPQGVADTSQIWVRTPTGESNRVEFRLITSGNFSPSLINWTQTTELPQALQGLGGVFVPVEDGAQPANYIYTIGGADTLNVATTSVYRATVDQTGSLGAWSAMTALPEGRAYAAVVAATALTAALDTTTTAAYLYVLGGTDPQGGTVSNVDFAHVDLTGKVGQWQAGNPLPAPLRGASAAIFRGFLYIAGGADGTDLAARTAYRAQIAADGSLGPWQSIADLPLPAAHAGLVNFGPYLYVVGGETGTNAAVSASVSGTETETVQMARINLRTGALMSTGWAPVASMAKARSKHSTVFAGGSLFTSSGVYSGQPGSSENTYAPILSDGSLESWNGATGAETVMAEIGYSLYNQAMVTFVDAAGQSHVLVLGGADRAAEGRPSKAVLFY
jgi:hypothetical protein